MQEQGYDMEALLLYQDNMSAMLLETNGKASSSKRTKHIKIKYFLVKDKIDQGDMTVEHCPTEQMWTDVNTKPKQGAVFRKFRGHMMGIPTEYIDADYINKVPLTPKVSMLPLTKEQLASKECVGDYESSNKEIRRWANGRPQHTEGPLELSKNNSKSALKDNPSEDRPSALKDNPTEDRPSESVEETSPPPPLIMIMGRSWSPSIYGAVRLLGNTVDVAWRMAFIHPLTFI
jgi:hypothetical protein